MPYSLLLLVFHSDVANRVSSALITQAIEIFFRHGYIIIVTLKCDFSRIAELSGAVCYRIKWKDQSANMIGYLITCSTGLLEFDACDFYLTVFYLPTSQQIKLYAMENWNERCFGLRK